MLWSDSIEPLTNDRSFDFKQLIINVFQFVIAVYDANDLFQNLSQKKFIVTRMLTESLKITGNSYTP